MQDVQIDIYGPVSKITGPFPKNAIRLATSYPVEGAKFSKAFKSKMWDGRKHLFRATTDSFPTGLLRIVKEVLDSTQTAYTVVDHRVSPTSQNASFDLIGASMTGKYDYQLTAVQTAVREKQGIIRIATGGGKSEVACAITKHLGLQTLFAVTTKELLYQGRERFKKRLGLTDTEIGIIGDGHWSPGTFVTIATIDTLESRVETAACQAFLKSIEVMFADEAHHMGSETWYEICMLCPAAYRYGLSGTPMDRTDGANLRLIAAIGDVIVDIPNKFLMERGISAKTSIIWTKITTPSLPKKITYPTAYKQGIVENPAALDAVIAWTKIFAELKLGTLILCEEIAHGKAIDDALWTATGGQFIAHQFIHGSEDPETRKNTLLDFAEGRLPVLIASTILDEGVDVPTIDALILAGSRKSKIKTMQRLGRGLRGKKLIAVEFANYCHDHLLRHSLARYEDYKKEECFPLYQSPPDIELVKRLWNESR